MKNLPCFFFEFSLVICSLFLFCSIAKTQTISELKTVTAFVYLKNAKGEFVGNGTGFFVGIKSQKDTSLTHIYFITASHVLKSDSTKYLGEFWIRLNTKDSSSFYFFVPIYMNGTNKNTFTHTDNSVDLTAVSVAPSLQAFDYKFLDYTFLIDRSEYKNLPIKEGDEAFFTGLFTAYAGVKRSIPIVRFGRIALIPNEKIEFLSKKREMILVESSSYGGNSGSPVYFRVSLPNGQVRLLLGGILNGTYRDVAKVETVQNSANPTSVALFNNGISVITPEYVLYELLFGKELSETRK